MFHLWYNPFIHTFTGFYSFPNVPTACPCHMDDMNSVTNGLRGNKLARESYNHQSSDGLPTVAAAGLAFSCDIFIFDHCQVHPVILSRNEA